MTTDANRPRDVLTRPVVLGAILLLALNDWVFKDVFPGPVSGKLSDLAGLFAFPLVAWGVLDWLRGQEEARPTTRSLAVIGFALGVFFVLLKTHAATRGLYLLAYELIGYSASVAPDPTDLFCLPAIGAAWLYGRQLLTRPRLVPERGMLSVARGGVAIGFVLLSVGTPAPVKKTVEKTGKKTGKKTSRPTPAAPSSSGVPGATPAATPAPTAEAPR